MPEFDFKIRKELNNEGQARSVNDSIKKLLNNLTVDQLAKVAKATEDPNKIKLALRYL
jgi:hypothetical protein